MDVNVICMLPNFLQHHFSFLVHTFETVPQMSFFGLLLRYRRHIGVLRMHTQLSGILSSSLCLGCGLQGVECNILYFYSGRSCVGRVQFWYDNDVVGIL